MFELIAKVIALISLIGGAIFWWYKKHPKLSVKICPLSPNKLRLVLHNKKDVVIEVRHIRLVKRTIFSSKERFEKNSFFTLVMSDTSNFMSSQDDLLNLVIPPENPIKDFEIEYNNLVQLYNFFVPYDYDPDFIVTLLRKPTKMDKCHIGVYLKSGNVQYIALPDDFYDYYRNSVGCQMDRDLLILSGQTDISLNFHSENSRHKHTYLCLKNYEATRRNYYLLHK